MGAYGFFLLSFTPSGVLYICYFKNNLSFKGENSELDMCCNTYGYIMCVIYVCVQVAVLRVLKAVSAVAERAVLCHKK